MITLENQIYEHMRASSAFSDYFILFHEVGHLMSGHLEENEKQGDDEKHYNLQRVASLLDGEVWKEELEADRYAANVLGKKSTIEGLKHLMMSSIKHDVADGVFGDKASQLVMNEYMKRIQALS